LKVLPLGATKTLERFRTVTLVPRSSASLVDSGVGAGADGACAAAATLRATGRARAVHVGRRSTSEGTRDVVGTIASDRCTARDGRLATRATAEVAAMARGELSARVGVEAPRDAGWVVAARVLGGQARAPGFLCRACRGDRA